MQSFQAQCALALKINQLHLPNVSLPCSPLKNPIYTSQSNVKLYHIVFALIFPISNNTLFFAINTSLWRKSCLHINTKKRNILLESALISTSEDNSQFSICYVNRHYNIILHLVNFTTFRCHKFKSMRTATKSCVTFSHGR